MARFLIALTLIFSALYADEPRAENRIAKAEANQPRTKTEVILRNTPNGAQLTINGQLIKLGEITINDLEKILGKEYRTFRGSDPFVWDELGIRIYTVSLVHKKLEDRDKNITSAISVELNRMPPYNGGKYKNDELPGVGVNPKELFKGYLEVDGAVIHNNMTIKDLNAKLTTIRPFYCMKGIGICSTSIVGKIMLSAERIPTKGSRYNSLMQDIQFDRFFKDSDIPPPGQNAYYDK
jgi:hypothetical protein